MTDQISHDSQYITGTGASGAGDGDDWQTAGSQRKGGSPSESGSSRATKSTVPSKVLVVREIDASHPALTEDSF